MNATINRTAIYAVFNDADTTSASFTERLLALGIGDRATAKPFAMEWAAKKYRVAIVQGQRGAMLPRNSAAEKAMNRVLSVCFPPADAPRLTRKTHQADRVTKLYEAWAKLSAAEKRRFATLQLKA